MAELPELVVLSRQMNDKLKSKEFESVEINQEKCLNMTINDFKHLITAKTVKNVHVKGKWIFLELTDDYHLLLNLGMGADVLYYESGEDFTSEYQCHFHFTDGSGFICKFWWFGHVELIQDNDLGEHKPTKNIAISPLDADFTMEHFRKICSGRSQIKNLILNQKKIGGIGNVYIHDILFKANIHPQKQVNTLKPSQMDDLYDNIVGTLEYSLNNKGLAYEKDFLGENGGFTKDLFLVAYKEGEKCPNCSTNIEKIKTGSTSSYICPQCQKL